MKNSLGSFLGDYTMKLSSVLGAIVVLLSGCSMMSHSVGMVKESEEVKKDFSPTLREIGKEDMEFLWKGFSKQLEGVEPLQGQVEMFQCLQVDVSACDELEIKTGGGYVFGTCLGIYTVSWDNSLREKETAYQCMKTISILREAKEE